jgi:PAS domain S-box-containing protein
LLCHLAKADRRKLLAHLSLCRRVSGRISTELQLNCRPGADPVFVELISSPSVAPDTGEQGFKSVITDITARKRAEMELRDAHGDLEERVRQRTRELTRANALLQEEITARKQADVALRESEERLRLMIEGTRDYAIFLLDTDGRVTTWNTGAEQITGYRAAEILGRHFSCFYTRADLLRGKPRRLLEAARSTGRAEDEGWRVRKGGSQFWASVIITAVYDQGGQLRGFLKVTRDITERREAQEVLRTSEKKLADFFDHSPFGLLWVSPRGEVRRVNRAGLEIFGCAPGECMNRPVMEFHADPAQAADILQRLARREVLQTCRAQLRRKDGTIRHVLIDASGLWKQGRMVHSRWFLRDITRRVELEREVLVVAERERQRIGQDLHDDLCQQLTGIEFLSQTLAGRLHVAHPEQADRAREIARLTREAIVHTRELAHGLSPVQLESMGLAGALQELAARSRRIFSVDCRFHCKHGFFNGGYEWGIHLYRIAQEAVSNAIKHGNATRLDIRLACPNGRLTLAVRDNGVGMPTNLRKRKGMGLHVMQYRAGVLGGTLALQANRSGGTTVLCTVNRSDLRLDRPEHQLLSAKDGSRVRKQPKQYQRTSN